MSKMKNITKKESVYQRSSGYSEMERCKLDRYVSNLNTWIMHFINMNGLVSSLGCHYEKASEEFALSKLRYEQYYSIPEIDYEMGALIPEDYTEIEREAGLVLLENESMFVDHTVQRIPGIKRDYESDDYYRAHAEGISFARRSFGYEFPSVIYTCFEEGFLTNHIMVCRFGLDKPVKLRLNRAFRKRIKKINDELSDHFGFSMRYYVATKHECWPDVRESFIPKAPMGFWFDEKSMTFDLEQLGIPGGGHLVFSMNFDEEGLKASASYGDNPVVKQIIEG